VDAATLVVVVAHRSPARRVGERASREDDATERNEAEHDGYGRDVRRSGREDLGHPHSFAVPRHESTLPLVPPSVHPAAT
jgi:hypothetical protein